MSRLYLCLITLVGLCCGCAENKPTTPLPPLQPVTGKVVRGKQVVAGGLIQFRVEPATPESRDLLVQSIVGPDGSFTLTTLNSVSQKKADGAPVGSYLVTYIPGGTDQMIQPTALLAPFTIKEGANDLTIDLNKR